MWKQGCGIKLAGKLSQTLQLHCKEMETQLKSTGIRKRDMKTTSEGKLIPLLLRTNSVLPRAHERPHELQCR